MLHSKNCMCNQSFLGFQNHFISQIDHLVYVNIRIVITVISGQLITLTKTQFLTLSTLQINNFGGSKIENNFLSVHFNICFVCWKDICFCWKIRKMIFNYALLARGLTLSLYWRMPHKNLSVSLLTIAKGSITTFSFTFWNMKCRFLKILSLIGCQVELYIALRYVGYLDCYLFNFSMKWPRNGYHIGNVS